MGQADAAHQRELLVLSHEPANLESRFSDLADGLTPTRNFFIRNHFLAPSLDPEAWRLKLGGAVERPLSFSLRELQALPATSHTSVLECAGNGRSFLRGHDEGVQWRLGAAGCARFTGVPVRDLLMAAGLRPEAIEVLFTGADHGLAEKSLKPKNEIHFSRSLPLTMTLRPEVLLTWEMNGKPLAPEHGAPVRLVVPGWYSVASVKWLREITVVPKVFRGYFQTVEYAYWAQAEGLPPERVPITELQLKSQIAQPAMYQQLRLGDPCAVHGAAWSSGTAIAQVEVSVDGGCTWQRATLGVPPEDHGWQLWHWNWIPSSPGEHCLMSRAIDAEGRVQPADHNDDLESYQIHHTLRIPVEVV